ncbi:MAG: hypothetical protein ACRD6X_19025 [Pyrinomonadaceae bacterium]
MVERNHDAFNPEHRPTSLTGHSPGGNHPRSTRISPDEIILWLANTYENKRARQVMEWEHAQTSNIRRSA